MGILRTPIGEESDPHPKSEEVLSHHGPLISLKRHGFLWQYLLVYFVDEARLSFTG